MRRNGDLNHHNDLQERCRNLGGKEMAEILGVSVTAPHQWFLAGCPRNDDKTWNLAEVFRWYRAKRQNRETKQADRGDALESWRRIKKEREDLRLKIEQGKLIDAEITFGRFQKFLADCKALMESLPDSIGLLLGETELRQMVTEEAKRIVADALRTMAAGETLFYEDALSASTETLDSTETGFDADGVPAA